MALELGECFCGKPIGVQGICVLGCQLGALQTTVQLWGFEFVLRRMESQRLEASSKKCQMLSGLIHHLFLAFVILE